MVAFDPTINLGNILTAILTIIGGFWAYHKWDIKIELRHQQNKNQVDNLDQKVNRIEMKIDENTRFTNGLGIKISDMDKKVEKHLVADEIIQHEIARRLDRLDGD